MSTQSISNVTRAKIDLLNKIITTSIQNPNDLVSFYHQLQPKMQHLPKSIISTLQTLFNYLKTNNYFDNQPSFEDYFSWYVNGLQNCIKNLLSSTNPIIIKDDYYITIPIATKPMKISFSREEVLGILACSFFGVDWNPKNTMSSSNREVGSISIAHILTNTTKAQQKLLCVYAYYHVMLLYPEKKENLIYELVSFGEHDWPKDQKLLKPTQYGSGSIETSSVQGQVDFANQRLMLHHIGNGATQEEIIFATRPECFLSLILFRTMKVDQCVVIRNTLLINSTSGFRQSFKWTGIHNESDMVVDVDVIAIDACTTNCFSKNNLLRDLNKARAGFASIRFGAVASGRWGCGVFHNDPTLKFFQQVAAASSAEIELVLFWIEPKEYDELKKILDRLIELKWTVSMLYDAFLKCQSNCLEYLRRIAFIIHFICLFLIVELSQLGLLKHYLSYTQ
ncbi:poly(ADP-ribose) glycohydrolase [Entamoeba marina]